MKRSSILLLCLLMCANLAIAGQRKKGVKRTGAKKTTEKAQKNQKAEGAQFRFKDSDTHNFGLVTGGKDVFHDFVFVNTGNQPLIIQDTKSNCACVTLEWPRQPIVPGGRGVLKVAFHPKKSGPFSKEVLIQSNSVLAPGEKGYVIHVKGTVE